MARNNNNLADPFNEIQEAEKSRETAVLPAKSNKPTKPAKSVTSDFRTSEYDVRKPRSIREMKAQLEAEKNRDTFEDKYRRATYFLERDIKKKLDYYSRFEEQGFRTRFVNYALRMALEEYEKDNGIE